MEAVRDQYGKLDAVVSSLNATTRSLLLRERREFLAAYRAHTFQMHDELRVLRSRIADEQSSQQKDEKVRRLTVDAEWFRKEAFALDERRGRLAKELQALKERLQIVGDDRAWLVREFEKTRNLTAHLRIQLAEVAKVATQPYDDFGEEDYQDSPEEDYQEEDSPALDHAAAAAED